MKASEAPALPAGCGSGEGLLETAITELMNRFGIGTGLPEEADNSNHTRTKSKRDEATHVPRERGRRP